MHNSWREYTLARSKVTQPYGVFALAHLNATRKIWLSPEYQREEVWTKPQKQLLIDSLLVGIDIPKFYFRAVDKPPYEYEVVDGQQRLRAIFEFLNNEYALPSSQKTIDGEEMKNKRFDQLSSVSRVDTGSDGIERGVTVRIQAFDLSMTYLPLATDHVATSDTSRATLVKMKTTEAIADRAAAFFGATERESR